jgi:hypothetical protein
MLARARISRDPLHALQFRAHPSELAGDPGDGSGCDEHAMVSHGYGEGHRKSRGSAVGRAARRMIEQTSFVGTRRRDIDMNSIYLIRTLHIPYAVIYSGCACGRVRPYRIQTYCAGRLSFYLFPLYFFCFFLPAVAQSNDQFIDAIDKIKRSVAPVICLNASQQVTVHGTAFFVDDNGTFLTAGHVAKEFLPSGQLYGCLKVAVYVPSDNWQRESLPVVWLQFLPEQCVFDGLVDVAKCKTVDNPSANNNIHTKPISVT